jgi:UDP-glucose 4-epimerase
MNVLVIGGAGYIGSHAVLELCENGHDVTVFDNLSSGHLLNIDYRAEFIQGDILKNDDLKNVFNGKFEAVLHFAALKAAGESMLEPGKYATSNITGTINILNKMLENNIKYFIFSSTAAVYGYPEYLPGSIMDSPAALNAAK